MMSDKSDPGNAEIFDPQPGTTHMPPWTVGELPAAPNFRWSQLVLMVGPGLVMGASAIGGGEWLTGPMVTARYGGALLWLATLSVVFQVIYNVEISRYTLYSGEPIFNGKFRLLPHPMFWVAIYLVLDAGSLLPYLAANAAIPLAAMIRGHVPEPSDPDDKRLLFILSILIFLTAAIPLLFGGKVYNSIRRMMAVKLVVVVGFLLFIAVGYSTRETWKEIGSGFLKFGNVPIVAKGDTNKNGIRDENEEPHGPSIDNLFGAMLGGRSLAFDMAILGTLASMAAISGNGGLTNTPISSFTRDQGWGMGRFVGAIPSVFGGHAITLSHSGKVFRVTADSLKRWSGWIAHVSREQYLIWLPACFIGLALPSMLSVQFLPRGTVIKDKWQAAAMTADKVAEAGGPTLGPVYWYLTLFCGLLILWTSMAATADGVLRRWIDVLWTASKRLQKVESDQIGKLYFALLCGYLVFGLTMLVVIRKGDQLLVAATGMMYNYALGFSCFHTLAVNLILLPKPLRPRIWQRIALVCGGVFFITIGVLSTISDGPKLFRDVSAFFSSGP